jgi:hypothetical protein
VLGFAWGVGFRAKKGLTGEHEVPGVHETVEAVVSGVAATVNQVEPSSPQWAGQIFIKRTGRGTFVLNVTSDDTVASVKARLKWRNSRLVHLPQELYDDTRSLGSYGVRKEDTLLLFGRLCGGAPVSEAASEHFQEGSQHDVAVVTSAPVPGTGSALEPNEPPATDQHAPVNDVQVRATVKPPMHQILKITRYSRVLLRTICKEVVLNSFITIIKFSKGRCIVTFT